MIKLFLFAQIGSQSETDQWLGEHPIVLGLIMLAIGGILLATGILELIKGVSTDKYGLKFGGKAGQFMAITRIIGGLIFCGFAISMFFSSKENKPLRTMPKAALFSEISIVYPIPAEDDVPKREDDNGVRGRSVD